MELAPINDIPLSIPTLLAAIINTLFSKARAGSKVSIKLSEPEGKLVEFTIISAPCRYVFDPKLNEFTIFHMPLYHQLPCQTISVFLSIILRI